MQEVAMTPEVHLTWEPAHIERPAENSGGGQPNNAPTLRQQWLPGRKRLRSPCLLYEVSANGT